MHDRKNENDTVKDARRAAEDAPATPKRAHDDPVDDGRKVTENATGKRERRDRLAAEREAESGHLGSGIGDDRPGRAAPREGEPE